MTPIVDVKSGMSTTWDSNPVRIEPDTIPANATPIGNPIASTEPNAMIKMMIANPRPRASDDGTSNSANACPPSSIRTPVGRRHRGTDVVTDRHRLFERRVRRRLELGVRDPPRVVTLGGDLPLIARRVRALQRLHPVDLGHLGQERLDHPANLRILDPVVRLEHDVADLAGALPAELVIQDVDAPLALHVRQREVGAVAGTHRPHHRAEHDDSENPQQQDPTTAPETHLGETLQHDMSFRGSGVSRTWSPRPSPTGLRAFRCFAGGDLWAGVRDRTALGHRWIPETAYLFFISDPSELQWRSSPVTTDRSLC